MATKGTGKTKPPNPPPNARAMLDKTVSERAFMQQIIDYGKLTGWLVYHTYDSRLSEPGFPDLVLCKLGHRIIFFECKTERGRVTHAQQRWISHLRDCGLLAAVVRPHDWGNIEQLLGGGDGRWEAEAG
jgi:hypothetical protein